MRAVQNATIGVPRTTDAINWNLDVESWWLFHPANPASPNYASSINSPANRVDVDGVFAGDLQAAIDSLPATGGTLLLGANSSYGRVVVTGKRNVHFLGQTGTTIRGVQLWGATICQSYTNWFTALRNRDSTALAVALNRPRNFYFKNIIFDGQGDACTVSDHTAYNIALWCRGVREIWLDGCTFQNYANQNPLTWHPGSCSGNGFVEGWWFRNCTFNASVNEAFFCDGLHDGGIVNSTFGNNTVSHFVLHLNNNDFTIDLDGDGVISPYENRNTQFVAYVGNTFNRTTAPAGGEALSITGGKALVKGNTLVGNGLGTNKNFVQLQTRVYNAYLTPPTNPAGGYTSYGSVVDSNILTTCQYGVKVDGQSGVAGGVVPPQTAGLIGKYTVKNNRATTITGWVVETPTVDGPNTVTGNTP